MKRSLQSLVGVAGVLACWVLCSCQSPKEPAAGLDWPMEGVAEIRAYRINWDDEFGQEGVLSYQGELKADRIPLEGIVLSDKQMAKLHGVTMGAHGKYDSADCFNPHHAFVFFDDDGNILGSMDVCFKCSAYVSSHDGFADYLDLEGLRVLLGALEIPISNPEW